VTLPRKKLKGGGQRNSVPVPSDEEASEEGQDQEHGLDEEDEGLGEEGGREEESGRRQGSGDGEAGEGIQRGSGSGGGGASSSRLEEALTELSISETELEGLNLSFPVGEEFLEKGWGPLQMRCSVAAVSAWQGRGQWQRFSIALCCEGVGVFACFLAEELKRKWRELVLCQLGPTVSLENMYKWKCKESADRSGKIGEGVYMN
jgi:hypothetical protein